jgi:hypothetical protein
MPHRRGPLRRWARYYRDLVELDDGSSSASPRRLAAATCSLLRVRESLGTRSRSPLVGRVPPKEGARLARARARALRAQAALEDGPLSPTSPAVRGGSCPVSVDDSGEEAAGTRARDRSQPDCRRGRPADRGSRRSVPGSVRQRQDSGLSISGSAERGVAYARALRPLSPLRRSCSPATSATAPFVQSGPSVCGQRPFQSARENRQQQAPRSDQWHHGTFESSSAVGVSRTNRRQRQWTRPPHSARR